MKMFIILEKVGKPEMLGKSIEKKNQMICFLSKSVKKNQEIEREKQIKELINNH